MTRFWFKHESWGDDWQPHHASGVGTRVWYHDDVAEDLAEKYYHDEPGNPSHFRFDVEVKDGDGVIQKFTVTAEADVNFYARESTAEETRDE